MRKISTTISFILLAFAITISSDDKSLTLDECLIMALKNNPAIQAAKYGSDSATYKRRAATANFLPVFKAEYAHTWLDEQPTFEIPAQPGRTIPGGTQDITLDLSSIGFPSVTVPVTFPDTKVAGSPAMQMPAGDDEIESVTVSVTQPIFTGGAITSGYKLAKMQEEISTMQLADVAGEIVYRTRLTFYQILKAREFVKVAAKAVEMGESLRKRTQDFYDVGMIAKNQLLEAEVNLAQMKQNQTMAQTGYDLARTGLAILIGFEGDGMPEVKGELNVVTIEMSLDECLKNGMRDRPDMHIAQKQVEMANTMVRLEQSGWTPQVALIGTYKHETGGFSSDEDMLSLTLGAQWTFFEWGKKYYNLNSSKSIAQAANQNLRLTRDRASLEIRQAYIRIQQAKFNIITAQASQISAEENLRVVQARFDQQLDTSFEVLKAQTLMTQAETNLIGAKADYITARAELDRAMGLPAYRTANDKREELKPPEKTKIEESPKATEELKIEESKESTSEVEIENSGEKIQGSDSDSSKNKIEKKNKEKKKTSQTDSEKTGTSEEKKVVGPDETKGD